MIVFIHFNKAGGMTLANIASYNCLIHPLSLSGQLATACDPEENNGQDWMAVNWWDWSEEGQKNLINKFDFIAFEVGPDDGQHNAMLKLRPDCDYITVLRDPLDMIYSRYSHLVGIGVNLPSAKEYLLGYPRGNTITGAFSNNWDVPNLNLAKEKLLQLSALMFVETFSRDIQVMKEKYYWDIVDTDKFRTGSRNNSNFRLTFADDCDFILAMEQKHALDLEFIDFAKSIQPEINKCKQL